MADAAKGAGAKSAETKNADVKAVGAVKASEEAPKVPGELKRPDGLLLEDVYLAFPEFASVVEQKVDSVSALQILKLVRWLKPHHDRCMQIQNKIAMKYGEVNEETKQIRVPSGAPEQKFRAELEMSLIDPVSMPPELLLPMGALKDVKISAQGLARISVFIKKDP